MLDFVFPCHLHSCSFDYCFAERLVSLQSAALVVVHSWIWSGEGVMGERAVD